MEKVLSLNYYIDAEKDNFLKGELVYNSWHDSGKRMNIGWRNSEQGYDGG